MKQLKLYLSCLFILPFYNVVSAQCTGGTAGSNLNITTSWQTVAVAGGKYYTFNGIAGNVYYFSFCGANGGSSGYDTQITLLNSFGNIIPGAFNDDFCGTNAYIAWECSNTSTYRVLVNKYDCGNQNNMGNLAFRYAAPVTCPAGLGTGVIHITSLPYTMNNGNTSGQVNDINSATADLCGDLTYYESNDRVWYFTPVTSGTVTINLNTNVRSSLSLHRGCPMLGNNSECIGFSQGNNNRTVTACLEQGITYYIIVDSRSNVSNVTFSQLTVSAPSSQSACNLGTTVSVPSLPYSSSGRTTCGKGNEVTQNNTEECGNSNYLRGEDEVFVFTPTATGSITVNISSAGLYSGLFLYEGCPLSSYCAGTGNSCIANVANASGTKSLCGNVVQGRTYYLIVDRWNDCLSYDITISSPSNNTSGRTCANAVNISSLPFNALNENTACMGDDYNNFSVASSGTLYESGEDKVYKYTSSGSECISIALNGASSNSIGYQVYNGCPDVSGSQCIASGGGAYSGTLTGSVTLPAAGTYYIVIDNFADPANVSYSISIESYGSAIVNDLPCNAVALTAGVSLLGDNNCAGGTGEPSPGTCFSSPNTLNTVWYKYTPSSSIVTIVTSAGTLRNSQIALYTGTCNGTLSQMGCNDNAPSCGNVNYTTANYMSRLNVIGLSPGTEYFISVDGYQSQTGTFNIIVTEGNSSLPPLTGQDCSVPLPVCQSTVAIGNPGFQSFGNVCDFPGAGTNCITTGERGSAWYELHIASTGNLEFDIIPNDWPGAPATTGTDYDFAIWKISGSGAVSCANISSGSTPLRCNYSEFGLTGLYSSSNGNSPAQYPGFGLAYQSRLPVTAGDVYLLMISNYSNSTSGFSLSFPANTPVDFTPVPSTVVWTGGIDTDWFNPGNWGGCAIPSCSTNAVISSVSVNQPVINASGASVKSLTLNSGSILTLNSNYNLSVCGDYLNQGIFKAAPSSTITLSGNSTQNLSGNMTGNSSFSNVVIDKTNSSAVLQNNLQIKGNLQVINPGSVLNGNSKYIYSGGNFLVSFGSFLPGNSGTLEFNGSSTQQYFNTGDVNNVRINHTGTGIVLDTDLSLASTGILTLDNGIIKTGIYEVSVANNNSPAVTSGNTNSYIDGFLRRSFPATKIQRSFDFPVGNSSKGYQLLNAAFYNGADPSLLDMRVHFNNYSSGLPLAAGNDPSCPVVMNSPSLNNGYWTMLTKGAGSADMHITLHNRSYTNATSSFTVMRKFDGGGWSIPVINSGSCISPAVTSVLRNGITQNFIATEPVDFATAQGSSALPVNLLSLIAEPAKDKIILTWFTGSESNNKGFEIYRAVSPDKFEKKGWVNGNGNTTSVTEYQFKDEEVRTNIMYYYRLRQLDNDGKESWSPIVAAILRDNGVIVFDVYPNPYREATQISYMLTRPSVVTVEVTDMMGKSIKKYRQGLQDAGRYGFRFSASESGHSAGVYNVIFWCDDQRYQVRITETK